MLDTGDIDQLAAAWQDYDNKLQERKKQCQAAHHEESADPNNLEFHKKFHALFHSNCWRPIIAEENKFAAQLRERARFGPSLLTRLQDSQRKEFRDFVSKQYAEFIANKKTAKKLDAGDFGEDDVDFLADESDLIATPVRREASYTVHLGGQLKKVMNVRLIAADPFQFLKRDPTLSAFDPVGLQTCMNLYSNSLHGLVLIIDEWDVWRGIWKDIAALCTNWPELHFEFFEEQVAKARNIKEHWESGDLLTTKHSNFREIHVLFHVLLTGNKMEQLESDDLNGRHPAILGLRTVMRQSWDYDLSVITLPLLLFRQYQPFMTSQWCQKRAELVLKCVKGFMIEMTSGSDDPPKTVQFLLPENIPEEIFAEISDLITTIFRSPNPLMKLNE